MALIKSNFEGFYRMNRADGEFDTRILKCNQKISEFVPLLPKMTNSFILFLYDSNQNQVFSNADIQITNGLYSISGQPIPIDICLELDE